MTGLTGKLGKAFFTNWELGKAKKANWELGNGFFNNWDGKLGKAIQLGWECIFLRWDAGITYQWDGKEGCGGGKCDRKL